jgi:putative addiction module component (TIGR02574 family)
MVAPVEDLNMSQIVAELLHAALTLSEPERAELVELLAASLTSPTSSLHPSCAAELRRRVAEIDSGQLQPVPWDEVRRQVQAQLDSDGTPNG